MSFTVKTHGNSPLSFLRIIFKMLSIKILDYQIFNPEHSIIVLFFLFKEYFWLVGNIYKRNKLKVNGDFKGEICGADC